MPVSLLTQADVPTPHPSRHRGLPSTYGDDAQNERVDDARASHAIASTHGEVSPRAAVRYKRHGTLGGQRLVDECTGKHAIAFRPWLSKSSPESTTSPSAGRSHGTLIELRWTSATHPKAWILIYYAEVSGWLVGAGEPPKSIAVTADGVRLLEECGFN
jgi:hypothetical protein